MLPSLWTNAFVLLLFHKFYVSLFCILGSASRCTVFRSGCLVSFMPVSQRSSFFVLSDVWIASSMSSFPPLDQLPDLDLTALDTCLAPLRNAALSTTYAKQKISLENEFVRFLSALPAPKTLFTAVLLDVCRFLVWKDKGGKTQVHHSSCPHLGLHGVKPCQCPIRLSHKTVDSLIGKLRALFQSAGRHGDWNLALGLGNPDSSNPDESFHVGAASSGCYPAKSYTFVCQQASASLTPHSTQDGCS